MCTFSEQELALELHVVGLFPVSAHTAQARPASTLCLILRPGSQLR